MLHTILAIGHTVTHLNWEIRAESALDSVRAAFGLETAAARIGRGLMQGCALADLDRECLALEAFADHIETLH